MLAAPLAAEEAPRGRGESWRTSQHDAAAAPARVGRLKWRSPASESDGDAADSDAAGSSLRPVERVAHVAGQLEDEEPGRGASRSRSTASAARRRAAQTNSPRPVAAEARSAVGDAPDAEEIAVRAVLLEPARLTIEDSERDDGAEGAPALRSARPLLVSQPVDEAEGTALPSRTDDVGAADELPAPAGEAAEPAPLDPVQEAPVAGDTEYGSERPVDCDEECPSPTDPRQLADLMSISIDITDPLPDRNLEDRQPDRRDRCWRDEGGDTLVARFGGYRDGMVVLSLPDGTERRVALDALHPLDRRHLYDLPQECSLGDDAFDGRAWQASAYHWKASSLCHKPLHFEEVALERYGHDWGPYLQPVVSAAHFFGTAPLIPYHIGLEPCCECIYPLGYYRPGSCAPYMIWPVPISARAALLEAAAVGGAIAVAP